MIVETANSFVPFVSTYPLAEAIISFVGSGRIERRVIAQHFNLGATVRDDDAATFAARLTRALTIYDPAVTAVQLNLLDSHDTPRFLSMVGGDTQALQLATLIQMTLPGAPSIYYGDEIGMIGEMDPYSRGSFPWTDPDRWDRQLLAYVSAAIAFRRANPVVRNGEFRVVGHEAQTIAYLRFDAERAALVVVNAGDRPCRLTVAVPELTGRTVAEERWPGSPAAWVPRQLRVDDGRLELDVAPRDGVVLTTR